MTDCIALAIMSTTTQKTNDLLLDLEVKSFCVLVMMYGCDDGRVSPKDDTDLLMCTLVRVQIMVRFRCP